MQREVYVIILFTYLTPFFCGIKFSLLNFLCISFYLYYTNTPVYAFPAPIESNIIDNLLSQVSLGDLTLKRSWNIS